jgi:hypothetical protein
MLTDVQREEGERYIRESLLIRCCLPFPYGHRSERESERERKKERELLIRSSLSCIPIRRTGFLCAG